MMSITLLTFIEEMAPRDSPIPVYKPAFKVVIVYIDFSKATLKNPSHFTRATVPS